MRIFKVGLRNLVATVLLFSVMGQPALAEESSLEAKDHDGVKVEEKELKLPDKLPRFVYDSGLDFKYPDAVRGIYLTGHSAGGAKFDKLIDFVNSTELNSMVIDIKDDFGNLTYEPTEDSPLAQFDIGKPYIKEPRKVLEELEKNEIYPIARVVVFKDTVLAEARPELSYKDGNSLWKNGRGEAFVNPFSKEVWDYNVEIAIEAAKMGFKEIQFDYVRFPEGFEKRDTSLTYTMGDYKDLEMENVQKRVSAVTDFVAYANSKLEPYGVDVSVDIFGYSATIPEAPGIGQNFSKISENVDVISSMIYPSHWGPYFGISKPDLEPYNIINEYAQVENKVLQALDTPPTSRPWIQDFTASYLGGGNYLNYGKAEVEAQIKALKKNNINEYLLWNAGNKYTNNVDYTP